MTLTKPCSYVITGATSGLGAELVRKLVERRKDARVLLAVRNVKLAESQIKHLADEFPDADVLNRVHVGPPLDLGDFASVIAFAEAVNTLDQPLHVLVNNAGMNKGSGPQTSTRWPEIISVNYLGPFLLTLLLEDKLKCCADSGELPSRVINVSSIMHRFSTLADGVRDQSNESVVDMFQRAEYGQQGRDVDSVVSSSRLYSDTKLGNALFTEWLNNRWKDEKNLRAMSVDPGGVVTGIWRNSRWEGSRLMSLFFAPASDGSEALYDCCVDPLNDVPEPANFYARGAFTSPLLRHHPQSKRLALAAGIVAAVDWPLRQFSGGRIANKTKRVPANEACYDSQVVSRLGDATEQFVRAEMSTLRTASFKRGHSWDRVSEM